MKSRFSIGSATPFIVLCLVVVSAIVFSICRRHAVASQAPDDTLPYYKVVAADTLPFHNIAFEEDSSAYSPHNKSGYRKKGRRHKGRSRKAHSGNASHGVPRDFLSDTIPPSE